MPISVERNKDSFMVKRDGEVIKEGLTNAQAWRLADKIMNDPISRQQDVSDWKAKKEANNE